LLVIGFFLKIFRPQLLIWRRSLDFSSIYAISAWGSSSRYTSPCVSFFFTQKKHARTPSPDSWIRQFSAKIPW